MEERGAVAPHFRLPWLLTSFAKALDLLSKRLATRFLWSVFNRPVKFKVPPREAGFHDITAQEEARVGSLGKRVVLHRARNDGNRILLVHGWNGRASQFHRMATLLHDHGFDITAVDLPGHGKSPRGNTNLPESADVIGGISGSHGPFHALISHSFGVPASLNAVRLGAEFEKLVMISPGFFDLEPTFEAFLGLFGLDGREYTRRMFEYGESVYGISAEEFAPSRFAGRIGTEALIVHCEDDREVSKEIAERLHDEMPSSHLHLTEGLGHRRILRDDEVARKIIKFIEGSS